MTATDPRHHQPDILEVLANLSSDAVVTPPALANAVLDLLPEGVWTDPTLRWLDPASKTGVFPREITRRLMITLADQIPDPQDRLNHILGHMVHAIATEEITAMLTRRTLYCSKDAARDLAAVQFSDSDGNVWHRRVEHDFGADGKCLECKGTREQLEQPDRDNKAYALIHEGGRDELSKDLDMKFDVILGNPPYQMDAEGGNRTIPVYNAFIDEAKKLNPRYMSFVIPSRWMAGGLGLNEFRESMLSDTRLRKLVDYADAGEVFPGVEIKGGVCFFLWDRDDAGPCEMTHIRNGNVSGPDERDLGEFDVLVRDARALSILHKVTRKEEPALIDILAADKEFGMTSNFSGYSEKKTAGTIPIFAIKSGRRVYGWIRQTDVTKSSHLIPTHKVLIPQAYGAGDNWPHQILGLPIVAPSPSCCTQSYLFIWVDSQAAAESAESYVRTRFFRFLVSLRKITQHATRSTYTWVPQQAWDRAWTDEALFKKYGITPEEQRYIESIVKEMPT